MIKLLLRSLDSLYTQHVKQTRLYLSLKVDGCRREPGGWARRALARLGVPRARPSQGGLSSQAVRSVSCSPATPWCWLLHGAWRRECALALGAVTVRSLASDARARPGRPRGACGPSEWLSFLSLRAPRDFSVVDWTFEHPEGLPLEAAPTPPGAQAAAHARCEGRVDVRFHSPRVAAGREIAGSDGGVGLAASSPPTGPPGGRPSVRRAAPRRRLPSPPPRPRQQPTQPVPSQPRGSPVRLAVLSGFSPVCVPLVCFLQ